MKAAKQVQSEKFSFSSSVKGDVWHRKTGTSAYEWWYFDALSDDGKDAIVVIFLDNFIFSPRYNSHCRKQNKISHSPGLSLDKSSAPGQHAEKTEPEKANEIEDNQAAPAVPAIAFIYYRNGKPVYRAINEFSAADFSADPDLPACRIGENSFRFESASYGSGYLISIKANLRRGRKLEAKLEWLSIESDFLPDENPPDLKDKHNWNLVAARSDVTGSIKVSDAQGKSLDQRHFRGTGYHDHNTDARWLPSTVKDWQWGRAHFSDATAIYYRYRELDKIDPVTKLLIIKNGELITYDASYEERRMRRSIFGVRFPKEISFSTENGIELSVVQSKSIDESFFYLRFLSEAKLKCPDSETREAFAVTEHLAPKALKFRWLDWLVNMRIGRRGKGSFL